MKIKVLMDFLEGRDSYIKDDTRTVSEAEGAYFVKNGWAEDTEGKVATGEEASGTTDLDINNSVIGVGDNHG